MGFLRVGKVVYLGVALAVVLVVTGAFLTPFHTETPLSPRVILTDRGETPLTLSAGAYLAVYVDQGGATTKLVEKNADTELPIASVTKLMTALVAWEHFAPTDVIEVRAEALSGKGNSGLYMVGEQLTFLSALSALFVASHNEIAEAIALSFGGRGAFVAAMNQRARSLSLLNTAYINPSGLDPAPSDSVLNHSSVHDLYLLTRYLREQEPDLLTLSAERSYELVTLAGRHLSLSTTNELIQTSVGPFRIWAGKTGETPRAAQNLVIVAEAPCGGTLYALTLGSSDRFGDMRHLLEYVGARFAFTCPQ